MSNKKPSPEALHLALRWVNPFANGEDVHVSALALEVDCLSQLLAGRARAGALEEAAKVCDRMSEGRAVLRGDSHGEIACDAAFTLAKRIRALAKKEPTK